MEKDRERVIGRPDTSEERPASIRRAELRAIALAALTFVPFVAVQFLGLSAGSPIGISIVSGDR
jgi:hypothetical protein